MRKLDKTECIETAKWLIQLRWIAVAIILSETLFARFVAGLDLDWTLTLYVAVPVSIVNVLYTLHLRAVKSREASELSLSRLCLLLNLEVSLDIVMLTLGVHLSGGIESPFIALLILYLVATGAVAPARVSYGQATLATVLLGAVAALEYYGVLPHLHSGFPNSHLHTNRAYVLSILLLVTCLFYLAVLTANFFASRLRERGQQLALTASRLEERVRELTTLREMGQDVISSLNLKTVLESIARNALNLSRAETVDIAFYDKDAGQFRHSTQVWASGKHGEAPPPRPDGLSAQVVKHGQKTIINDAQSHPLFNAPNARQSEVKAIASFPLNTSSGTVGVLNVVFHTPHTFSEEELRALDLLADQAAIAAENAHLYEQQIAMVNELRELNRLKDNLVSTVSHDVRSPTAVIRGFADLLLSGQLGPLNTEHEEALQSMKSEADRILDLAENLLDLQRARLYAVRKQPLSLRDVAQRAERRTRVLASERGLAFHTELLDDPAMVEADPGQLDRVLNNLLHNALKFTPKGGQIGLRLRDDGQFWRMEVWDTGTGIPRNEQCKIFEQFYRGEKSDGTGLGLAIVKEFIETHDGRVWVESKEGQGSTFIFILPKLTTQSEA